MKNVTELEKDGVPQHRRADERPFDPDDGSWIVLYRKSGSGAFYPVSIVDLKHVDLKMDWQPEFQIKFAGHLSQVSGAPFTPDHTAQPNPPISEHAVGPDATGNPGPVTVVQEMVTVRFTAGHEN